MELHTSLHKRSKSDYTSNMIVEDKFSNIFNSPNHPEPDVAKLKDSFEHRKRHFTNTTVQNSLKQEILELQKQLENQFAERGALESAMFCKSASHDFAYEYSISKFLDTAKEQLFQIFLLKLHESSPNICLQYVECISYMAYNVLRWCQKTVTFVQNKTAKDLITEVAALELEVIYLEKYLLSMYRKTFAKRLISRPTMDESPKANSATDEQLDSELPPGNIRAESVINAGCSMPSEDSLENSLKDCRDVLGAHILVDSSIGRSLSSLSQRSSIAFRTSSLGPLAEAVESYHSLPLSMLERVQSSENVSLAEHSGPRVRDHFWETPNKISEEMIKSISAIYCQLAEPPLHGFPSSPVSFSTSRSSPRDQHYTWNLHCKEHSWLDNSCHIESSKEFIPPFPTVAEVQGIRRDSQSLSKIEPMLQQFRCLVSSLEVVDPKKMKHEEKLAFWINVHNALVMHAFLVYGIRRSNLKRISLLLKAAYNVGGHTISVDMIQSSILDCRLPRPGQWLQSFFFPRPKYKARDSWKTYAIVHPEPRLHFALCSGSHSDPMVHLYTPKRVFQELEVAKEEYIQTNVKIQKELKLLVPKKVESFAKEWGLSPSGLVELIEHSLPSSLRKFQQPQRVKLWKKIVWVPHNFTFRYLISDELLN